jgi:hypothetical protein
MIDGFIERLEDFIQKWNDQVKVNYREFFDGSELSEELTYKKGRKYAKLFTGGSVVAFIDMNNGDIYKPAGWKAPAKHVRGNIFSDQGGFEAVARPTDFIFSIRYLR